MKKLTLLMIICMVGMASTVQAQQFSDFIEEMRGDTAVVLSSDDTQEANTLLNAITYDEDRDENRVYLLKRDHRYLQNSGPANLPADTLSVIMGEEAGPIVGGTEEDGRPPIIAGTIDSEGSPQSFQFININGDFIMKNVAHSVAATDGSEDWFGFEITTDGAEVIWENNLLEHNGWTFIQSNTGADNSITIRDSYILNATGKGTRRNGGVYDSENNALSKLVVENTTHLQMAGMLYKFRNHPADSVFINHNTFVNSTGQLFASFGYETNFTATNNLFVNSNIQAYYPGLDYNETNQDYTRHGIINLSEIPDTAATSVNPEDRKVLVSNNAVYWSDEVSTIHETLNENSVPCPDDEAPSDCLEGEEWVTQAVNMNSATQNLFNDDENYPLLTEGNWIEDAGAPDFTSPNGLMTDALQAAIDWSIVTAESGNSTLMEKWRSEGNEATTGESENFLNFDWPVAADLSYSNEAYLTGGMGGFPVGDLNWFATEKENWDAQKENEYSQIGAALNNGQLPTSNEGQVSIPTSIKLDQNYPNPFNPTTQINFTLPQAQEVTINVYDMLGRKVATIVERENFSAGENMVTFDANNLSSGVYIYSLEAGDISLTKKMTLIK